MTICGWGEIFSRTTHYDDVSCSLSYSSFLRRYRGIGIRTEDDVLITEDGADVLTAECPKEVEDIERLMSHTDMTMR